MYVKGWKLLTHFLYVLPVFPSLLFLAKFFLENTGMENGWIENIRIDYHKYEVNLILKIAQTAFTNGVDQNFDMYIQRNLFWFPVRCYKLMNLTLIRLYKA